MYTHASSRDGSIVEDFLSSFAKRLPLKEGEEDPEGKQADRCSNRSDQKIEGC